jgi:predicted nucleic acid-binding protein
MTRTAYRADFFDACSLVKVYCDEPGSEIIRPYFQRRSTKYTTPFCFYEALNTLKGKWKYGRKPSMTLEQYLDAVFQLTAWYGASSAKIKDLNFADPLTFADAQEVARRNELDLSDAFQILSVKKGWFSGLVNESSTLLVTSDRELAAAAEREGVRAWFFLSEPEPQ